MSVGEIRETRDGLERIMERRREEDTVEAIRRRVSGLPETPVRVLTSTVAFRTRRGEMWQPPRGHNAIYFTEPAWNDLKLISPGFAELPEIPTISRVRTAVSCLRQGDPTAALRWLEEALDEAAAGTSVTPR